MSDWVGGLPPSAHSRIEQQRSSGAAGSLLSAPAAAAIRSAGLAPAGEVFGCLVMNLGWSNNGCAWRSAYGGVPMANWGGQQMFGGTSPVTSTGSGRSANSGFAPYVHSFEAAWHGALDRMLAEARALGADGVVGVTIGRSHLDGQAWEFAALGTAVRVVDASLVPRTEPSGDPWCAGLSAEDCAAAILSGRIPGGMVLGLAVATKHEDWQLKQQRSSWSNTEVDGLTELLQTARHDARQIAAQQAARFGGDLVIKGMALSEFETPCGQEADVHAEAAIVGTVLRTLAAGSGAHGRAGRAVPILPLGDLPRS